MPILRTNTYLLLRSPLGEILRYEEPIYTTIKYGYLYNWWAATNPAIIEYGYLYNWYAATDTRNIAASGWSIGTETQWTTLSTYLGGNTVSGGHLKESGTSHWITPNTGADNTSGFNARGASQRLNNGTFLSPFMGMTIFHIVAISGVKYLYLNYTSDDFLILSYDNTYKPTGASIRLVKDSTTLTHGQTGTYTGNNGRVYSTICIGTQEWLSENLMETRYRNGDAIPEVTDNTAWSALTTGARCSYNNTLSNAGTGNAITSSDDWIVPSETQWRGFFDSLDTYDLLIDGWPTLGTKLRETGWNHWYENYNGILGIEGTNDYGFSARGGGNRSSVFSGIKEALQFATSTIYEVINTQCYFIGIYYDDSISQIGVHDKYIGVSIRLCNPNTSLSDGQSGTYTQNDGTILNTIVINGVEWLSDNLAETKYRDGSTIPVVTDNTAWSNLTTGARCVYNNDESNM